MNHSSTFNFLFFLFAFVFQIHNAHAEKQLQSLPFDSYVMDIFEVDSATIKVSLNFEKAPDKVSGFIVESPNRIVIDIFGIPSRTARGTNLESKKINRIRVGIHQDKTRIVLDSPVKSRIEISQSGDPASPVFLITFPGTEKSPVEDSTPPKTEFREKSSAVLPTPTPEATKEPTPTRTPAPVPTPTPLPSPTPIPTPLPTPPPVPEPTPKPLPTKEEVPLASPKPTPVEETKSSLPTSKSTDATIKTPKESLSISEVEDSLNDTEDKEDELEINGKAVIKTIVFQTTSENFVSSVVVSATSLGAYTLNQIAPREYELVLKKSRLKAPHLELPQFPPDSFKGFSFIRASEKEDSVLVHIYVDEGVRLAPYIAQDKLWVRVE